MDKKFAAIITGASSGIGKALAVRLAKNHQARIVINARSKDALEETGRLIEHVGGQAVCVVGDMSDQSMPKRLVETCMSNFEQIDLLVNNAGFGRPGSLASLTIDDWRAVFEVNFFAPLATIYAALPHFLERKRGMIVNVSSVAGKIAFPGSVCYSSSKFALTGMSEGMAAELSSAGIDTITVCPGWVRSEFFEKNNTADDRNPTLIAQQKSLKGWLMRSCLSISSEETAHDIEAAIMKGGSSELILTAPGAVAERIAGVFPGVMRSLAKRIPPSSYADR